MKSRVPDASGQVRIIGGRLRGSKLAVPASEGLRPTPDRVRETLFNWLQPVIAGARCLDLFAGTGALGIEALSRGAAEVTFVERSPSLAAALRDNLQRLQQHAGTVCCAEALQWLSSSTDSPCNVVFLDPPFAADLWRTTISRVDESTWLAGDAWVYIESPVDVVPEVPVHWRCHRQARAGSVRHALYRCNRGDPLSWARG